MSFTACWPPPIGWAHIGKLQPAWSLLMLADHERPDAELAPARRANRWCATPGSWVEIVLANGRGLRVDAGVEAEVLQRLVGALEAT